MKLQRRQQQQLRPSLAHRQQKLKLGIAEREERAQVMLLLLPEARHSNAGAMEVTALQIP
jgi:hypothetical protein